MHSWLGKQQIQVLICGIKAPTSCYIVQLTLLFTELILLLETLPVIFALLKHVSKANISSAKLRQQISQESTVRASLDVHVTIALLLIFAHTILKISVINASRSTRISPVVNLKMSPL
jgi:hypothetical protein